MLAAAVAYILLYIKIAPGFQDVTKPTSGAILRAQAFGTCAFLMLTFILCIGPLARLDQRFLPLLYNRRHFGVITCAIAFTHATHVVSIYYSFSPLNKYVAVLASNTSYDRFLGFPFETFGIFALFLLLVLAATSHDFWLRFLTPPIWKAIHISVYVAYAAIVCHVALGSLQSKQSPLLAVIVGLSVVAVTGLHLVAGRIERQKDRNTAERARPGVPTRSPGSWRATWTPCLTAAASSCRWRAASASRCFATATSCRPLPTFAPIRTGRSARDASWTAA